MSDDFLTQFPRPPELQPISSSQARPWQIASLLFIVVGLVLLGAGAWMFYQYQLEASKPPPARILEVSVPEETDASAPQPSPVVVAATATLTSPLIEIVAENPTASPTLVIPTSTPFVMQDIPAIAELMGSVTPNPTALHAPPLTPTPTGTSVPVLPTPTPLPPATTTSGPSLAENPLVLPEDALTPSPMPPAPVPAPAGTVAVSPPTRIVAESIGLDASVIEVGWTEVIQNGTPMNVWVVADYAAGWHKNSTLPGQGGNVVLSGHHNIKGEVFRYIIDINIGDLITLYVGDQPYQYTVVDKFIVKDKDEPEAVRRENAKWIGPFNEERLTLVTCWPYTNNTHRAIVIAKPVSAAQGSPAQ